MPSKSATMQSQDPVQTLRAYYPLPDVIHILRTLQPLLTEHGKAYLPYLESELAANPSAARLSISTLGSSRSARSLASPLFERSSSGMAFSDASSINSGFLTENEHGHGGSQHALAPNSRERKHKPAPGHRVAKPAYKASAASSPILSPRRPSFECPFCWELNIPTSISRKADLKRHFKQFHQNNAQWICQERGCSKAFDWKSAFEAHLKENHGNTQHPADTCQVKLCPQVVFACGFSNCRLVFEAANDDEAEKKAQEYFNHVANHFDDNLTHKNWSFSVRIRNLMRQAAVETHWKDRKKGPQDPIWQPHTSSVVRKILETRHFTDIPLLVQWVVNLGSFAFSQPHSPIPKLPAALALPIKDQCNLVLDGHGPSPTIRRDSHRHMSTVPPTAERPVPDPEPEPEPEPVDTAEPEPEPVELKMEYPPPTDIVTATTMADSQPMSSPTFHEQPYTSFPHHDTGHLISPHGHLEMDTQPTTTTTATAGPTTTQTHTFFNGSHPITSWLSMTDMADQMSMQPHLDQIISFPQEIPPEFRPVTPAHQMMGMVTDGDYAGIGVTATIAGTMQQGTIAPVDLEMRDCMWE